MTQNEKQEQLDRINHLCFPGLGGEMTPALSSVGTYTTDRPNRPWWKFWETQDIYHIANKQTSRSLAYILTDKWTIFNQDGYVNAVTELTKNCNNVMHIHGFSYGAHKMLNYVNEMDDGKFNNLEQLTIDATFFDLDDASLGSYFGALRTIGRSLGIVPRHTMEDKILNLVKKCKTTSHYPLVALAHNIYDEVIEISEQERIFNCLLKHGYPMNKIARPQHVGNTHEPKYANIHQSDNTLPSMHLLRTPSPNTVVKHEKDIESYLDNIKKDICRTYDWTWQIYNSRKRKYVSLQSEFKDINHVLANIVINFANRTSAEERPAFDTIWQNCQPELQRALKAIISSPEYQRLIEIENGTYKYTQEIAQFKAKLQSTLPMKALRKAEWTFGITEAELKAELKTLLVNERDEDLKQAFKSYESKPGQSLYCNTSNTENLVEHVASFLQITKLQRDMRLQFSGERVICNHNQWYPTEELTEEMKNQYAALYNAAHQQFNADPEKDSAGHELADYAHKINAELDKKYFGDICKNGHEEPIIPNTNIINNPLPSLNSTLLGLNNEQSPQFSQNALQRKYSLQDPTRQHQKNQTRSRRNSLSQQI